MLLQDLRFAVRSFLRAPRFTVPAVIALALGIGATSAIFSVVRGVLLEPLPYRDPERIVAIWEHRVDRNRPRNVIASANFVAWRERNKSFELLGMVGPSRQNIVLDGQPQEVAGFFASSDALAAFGTQPQLGRLYTPDEDLASAERVVVISHEFWQARLGGRSDVLGTSLTMNQQPRTVIGVMPPAFTIEGLPVAYMIPYGWTIERLRQSPGPRLRRTASRDCATASRSTRHIARCGPSCRSWRPRRRSATPTGRSPWCRFTSRPSIGSVRRCTS